MIFLLTNIDQEILVPFKDFFRKSTFLFLNESMCFWSLVLSQNFTNVSWTSQTQKGHSNLTTIIRRNIHKKKMNQTNWWKLCFKTLWKQDQLLSKKFRSSIFRNRNCSFRYYSCQINFRYFGHIIFHSLHSTNIILATRHITSRNVLDSFHSFSILLKLLNHLIKSIKCSQFDRTRPYLSNGVLQVLNRPSV